MDHVRPKDIVRVTDPQGVVWVNPLGGGISTRDRKVAAFRWWWVIPQGISFDNRLTIRNDHDGHWVWEPTQGMEFAQYVQLLATLNSLFTAVP
jgi:hypothetical protein